jgi:hypothetical protein
MSAPTTQGASRRRAAARALLVAATLGLSAGWPNLAQAQHAPDRSTADATQSTDASPPADAVGAGAPAETSRPGASAWLGAVAP